MIYDTHLDCYMPSDEYVTKHGAVIERRYPYREALRMMVENRDYDPWHTSAGSHLPLLRSPRQREWLKHNPGMKFPRRKRDRRAIKRRDAGWGLNFAEAAECRLFKISWA
jgi:hypothetical protein